MSPKKRKQWNDVLPLCPLCQKRPVEKRYGKQTGTYRKTCRRCGRGWEARRKKMLEKADMTCKFCGFKALHGCQLDIDHIDGNHKNNNKTNLQVLCANCHRLKTYVINKDHIK